MLLGLSASTLYAYPNYIGHGYSSCLSCHYNPNGNGPLNDYGRVVASSAIADRMLWSNDTSDQEIADRSGFFFTEDPLPWLRPSLNFRSLRLMRNVGKDASSQESIPMDTSVSLVGKFLPGDRLTVVGQLAYLPERAATRSLSGKTYQSREHYVGYRLTKELGVYAGLMDKAFGIRVADHTAFSRITTENTQYHQTHGVLLHYLGKSYEISIQPFIGNLSLENNARTKGVSTLTEVNLGDKSRVGFSLQGGKNPFSTTYMAAAHSRIGIGKGHSVLAELGRVLTRFDEASITNRSLYLFTQSHFNVRRGQYSLITIEYQRPDENRTTYTYRIAPGIQFFPMQRIELRADAFHTTRVSELGTTTRALDLTAQVHLWF